jgi:hypothetical protein
VPEAFGTPPACNLDTDFLFNELGESDCDQELRHGLIDGFSLMIKPNLEIVMCPHLMSLAFGFDSTDSEMVRRTGSDLRYLERVCSNADQGCFIDGTRIILAFGCLPFRAHAQGSVGRKNGGKRRPIGDLGCNRKHEFDNAGISVGIVNELVRGADFPKENKTNIAHNMHANSVLQHAARIWGERVVCATDDFKDFFN